MKGQTDIFGETQSEDDELGRDVLRERYPSVDAARRTFFGTQSRLFEPQMEGQLALEMRTAPEGAGRGATTEEETNPDGRR